MLEIKTEEGMDCIPGYNDGFSRTIHASFVGLLGLGPTVELNIC